MAENVADAAPVVHAPRRYHQNAGKRRKRQARHHAAEQKHGGEQENGVEHARKACLLAGFQVTSEQIKELTPTMTREDVLSLLGDTQDVGSGIYIYLYEVDQQYLLRIPFASDEAQLGVAGEDLLKALVPISGDIAPMVYVNDTLYQIVDSQPNFADEKSLSIC